MSANLRYGCHRELLDAWLESLIGVPAVEVVWLEGSLVDNHQPNQAADIDIRFGLADEAFDQLWKNDPTDLLKGLGDYVSLQGNWRLLTRSGIVVEIMAFQRSELEGKELHDWEILYLRPCSPAPSFKKLPVQTPAETWPNPEELNVEKVGELTRLFLHYGATAAAPLYSDEIQASRFSLELIRTELMKLLFRRAGVWFFKRYKHLSEVLTSEFLSDLESTYDQSGLSALHSKAIAIETLKTMEIAGKHLREIGDQVGGGFEPEWFDLMLTKLRVQLNPFISDEAAGV